VRTREQRALVQRIARATREALGPSRGRLLVGVSGGADSATALVALSERADAGGWSVVGAHVDHGLADASTRAAFRAAAASVTDAAGVELVVETADVTAGVRSGHSVETAAREGRYRCLARMAAEVGAVAVVTGHTADDQAESVLLHLIRGSGLDGLAGMAPSGVTPVALDHPPPLVRPLLGVRRAETHAFCVARGLAVVDDPANMDPAFTRNRVRRSVVPALTAINPQVVEALCALAAAVRPDRDWLEAQARDALTGVRRDAETAMGVTLSRRAVRALPESLRRRVVRLAVLEAGGAEVSAERTQAIVRLVERGGHRVECGGGVLAEARADTLRVWRPASD